MMGQLVWNGIVAGSIYALTALGFVIIYRTVKFFHFAHGAVYTAGAYLAYMLYVKWHWPIGLSFFLPQRWRA
jgi:branched-chain amino acid transport system permease protein